MHDLLLLRCQHCQETIRLVVYEQSHAYIAPAVTSSDWPTLADWLAEHIEHHPAVAACEFDLGERPGFEVITWGQLQDEREALDRAGVVATFTMTATFEDI